MLKFLKHKVLPLFNGRATADKQPVDEYGLGLNGPASAAASGWPGHERQKGARDALRQGRPENIVAILDNLDLNSYEPSGIPGRVGRFYERGVVACRVLGDLDKGQVLQVMALVSPEKRQALLDETLAQAAAVNYAADAPARAHIDVLIAAGANVDCNEGLPLRRAAIRGLTENVQKLHHAGADFKTALFGAGVGVGADAGPEVRRKLKIYERNEKAPADIKRRPRPEWGPK
ncbi:MAG: hypothetical protein ACAH83_20215 [Alphaproteobacteria bacterium]